MRAKVHRSILFSAISHSMGIVDKKPTLQMLSHVLLKFEDGKIIIKSTDLDHSMVEHIDADVDTFGAYAVPAQMLYDISRKLSDNSIIDISLSNQGEKLVIQSAKSRFELKTASAEDFPVVENFTDESSFLIKSEKLKKIIDLTKFSMSVEETRYNLNGLYLHTDEERKYLKSAATDGHRLAVSAIEMSECKIQPGIFSRKTILELRKLLDEDIDEIKISMGANRVQFLVGNVTLNARLVDGTFPNYSAVIPPLGKKYFVVNRKAFIDVIDRVSIMSDDKSKVVKLNLTADGILCCSSANITTGGSGKDEIQVDQNEIDQWDACFNGRYLLDIAEALNCENLKFHVGGKLSSVLILPDNDQLSQFVVMPMRI